MNDYGEEPLNPTDDDRDSQWFEEARRRVRTPGTILFVFGLISVFFAVTSLALNIVSPDTIYRPLYDWFANFMKEHPQNPPQPMPPYDKWVQQQLIQSIAGNAFSLICSFFMVVGGSKMKQLRGYGLAMTGAIMAMIPCTNSCCCTSVPFGIWALVVLINSDVKLAFARTKAGPAA